MDLIVLEPERNCTSSKDLALLTSSKGIQGIHPVPGGKACGWFFYPSIML